MKKLFVVFLALSFSFAVFAQTNSTVDVSDEVYYILTHAELRGLCSTLSTIRPYTEKYIVDKLDEILSNLEKLEEIEVVEEEYGELIAVREADVSETTNENDLESGNLESGDDAELENSDVKDEKTEDDSASDSISNSMKEKNTTKKAKKSYKNAKEYIVDTEYEVILREKERFVRTNEKGFKKDLQHLGFRYDDDWGGKIPVSLEFSDTINGFISPGLYHGTDNVFGYELFNNFNFRGDLGKYISYYADAYIGITKIPLEFMGTYDVGYWWYGTDKIAAAKVEDLVVKTPPFNQYDSDLRRVNTYRNRSTIPYSFSKYWDGNTFHFGNINNGGLEDWPTTNSMSFGMFGEIHASLFDNKIELGASRIRREWGAMDNGASLVLNSKARPFFALDNTIHLFSHVTLSGLIGFLEFPNQGYINATGDANAWPNKGFNQDDFVYFQNAFAIGQLDLDFKYFHFDFGSTVVFPKRFELGYAFPLIDKVVYQDNLGDCDNLALFGNIKFRNPGVGSVWVSGYLDEMPELNPMRILKEMFKYDRYMFAYQVGGKLILPVQILPFATFSMRYTKIEPYCYTHQAINYAPWYYGNYLMESYTNNGESLGYYLPPNSDEFLVRLDVYPSKYSTAAIQYQLIHHGADYGSRQVDGSSLYSELTLGRFEPEMTKHFLKDGAYEWINMFSLQGSYDFKQFKVPVVLNYTFGLVFSNFTDTDSPLGEQGVYHRIETDEYKATTGFIFTIGFTIFGR